jgi:hypothetical protein
LQEHWPPPPSNAPRTLTLGVWRLDIDADRIGGSRIDDQKHRWRFYSQGALILLTLAGASIAVMSHVPAPPVTLQLFGATVVLYAGAFVMQKIGARQLPSRPFVIRRNPKTVQIGRDDARALPQSYTLTLANTPGAKDPIYLLNLTFPEENGKKAHTIRLAYFGEQSDARTVKAEIENFLTAAPQPIRTDGD